MVDAVIVQSLKEFYTPSEIREFWQEALAALMSRQTLNLHLNSRGKDGSSSAAITLSTAQDQRIFCASCARAVAELEETAANDQGGAHTDFSRSPVLV